MKSKLSKITIVLIFLILSSLFLANNVKASRNIDGTTYYTHDDVHWKGGWIDVNGNWYYCKNHGWNLTGHLGNNDTIVATAETDWTDGAESEAIWVLKTWIEPRITDEYGIRTALTLDFGSEQGVSDKREAALYAFATQFYGNPSKIVQQAIWEYINKHGGDSSCETEGPNEINRAADYYADTWSNRDNKPALSGSSSNAKARINGNDYIVGPFWVSYDDTIYGNIKFVQSVSYSISVPGAQITDVNGNPMGGIPNGQDFYIKFPYSETLGEVSIDVSLHHINSVEARKWDVKTQGWEFELVWNDPSTEETTKWIHSDLCTMWPNLDSSGSCPYCSPIEQHAWKAKADAQMKPLRRYSLGKPYQNMRKIDGSVSYADTSIRLTAPLAPVRKTEMDLAGYVWEDVVQGKDQSVNGEYDNGETKLEGIEVRLYRADTGALAEVNKGTNPTLTDRNGYYEFKGVNPTYKYFVLFVYDGMIYTNTYGAGTPEYNTEAWNISSKGSEIVSERNALNSKFVTIGSYPASYRTNPIFGNGYLTNGYNKIFGINDNLVNDYKNRVTSQLRNYLSSHNRLEDGDQNYFNNIYWPIINSSSNPTEAKQVLQYIWDCRIKAYAGYESERDGKVSRAGGKYYPVYDRFALLDNKGDRITSKNSTDTWQGYRIIYNGQLHINLGLIRRPTTDLQLDEDLYKTVVSLNGQDEIYEYGSFDKRGVKLNAVDAMITQNIATSDYDYRLDTSSLSSNLSGIAAYPVNYAPIEVYVTYRINIRNNSNIPTGVNEIVTYMDSRYYSYSDSYKTTGGMNLKGIEGTYIDPNSTIPYTESNLTNYDAGAFGLKVNTNSRYGTGSETGKNLRIKDQPVSTDLYISFDRNVILEQNDVLAVYITYRLGENSTTNAKFNCTHNSTQANGGNHAYAILQDLFRNTDNKKLNVYTGAEINAYSTFFKKDFDVRETQNKYNSYYNYSSALSRGSVYRAAGVLDVNSISGNLNQEEISRYEQTRNKTENDWDRASTFVLMDGGIRSVAGNVWETVDEPANYWANTGAYPKFKSEYGAEGITVELIEIKNGAEYIRAKTTTDGSGAYRFTEYIPGLYTIRFIYGDNAKYDTTQYSKYTTFRSNEEDYKCAYNGEFYQSAKANPKTNDNQYWYAVEEGDRYSDAYDEVAIRKAVNESLQTYKYNDVVGLLKHPTDYMVYAYTSLLDLEVEKAKTQINASDQNPSYEIQNVDFALTPRTESKLSINKEVTHLKLVLQNGAVQFDADTKTIREQGVPAVVQAMQGYDINISMSSELINGATLEITYKITVTNEGPEDTITYYKDSSGNIIALGFYKEDPTNIIYYEDGRIRTYDNRGTFTKNGEMWVSNTTAGRTAMRDIALNRTETIETTTRADLIADFVSNNLNFTKTSYTGAAINDAWDLYTGTKAEFEAEYYKQKQNSTEQSLSPQLSKEMDDEAKDIYDSNAIVLSNNRNALVTTNLKHGESVSEEIVLSKVISVNNDSTDTKSYTNKARIVRINNAVSRVQDMAGMNLTHTSEHVIVSDPTGIGNIYLGIILTLVVAVIIGIGIVFIKKFVIKNK